MMRKMKEEICDILIDLNQSKDTTIGVLSFLQTEDETPKMLNWLQENKKYNPSQHEILTELDRIND